MGGSGSRALIGLHPDVSQSGRVCFSGSLTNVPGCCQNARAPCPVHLFPGLFVGPSDMTAGLFHNAGFKWKQSGSHHIIYDLASEVTTTFSGLHEWILFCVREPHKAKNARRQGPLWAPSWRLITLTIRFWQLQIHSVALTAITKFHRPDGSN